MRTRLLAAFVVAVIVAGCSPGSLPGSPTPILFGGGGGRYDGTLTYRRLSGNFVVNEAAQGMTMSLALTADPQFSAEFQAAGGSRGTLQGTVNGALNNGTFLATLLVTTPASQAAPGSVFGLPSLFRPRADGDLSCEGRGDVTGTFSGPNITWTTGAISYSNCPGLVTSAQARATAVSPIPQSEPARARVVVTIYPGTTIQQGRCDTGQQGYQFTVEMAETNGVAVTLDDTVLVEERRGNRIITSREDNPFTSLAGGERRRYSGCSLETGTYQAFFSGRDANGNALRFASPVITFGRSN